MPSTLESTTCKASNVMQEILQIPFGVWIQQSTSLLTTCWQTQDIRMGEAEPELISKYHMRPVLVIPVLLLACSYPAVATMINQKSVWAIQIDVLRIYLISSTMIVDTEKKCFPHDTWHGIGLGDGTSRHFCVFRCLFLRNSMTWQPKNEFNNHRSDIGWWDCYFTLRSRFTLYAIGDDDQKSVWDIQIDALIVFLISPTMSVDTEKNCFRWYGTWHRT